MIHKIKNIVFVSILLSFLFLAHPFVDSKEVNAQFSGDETPQECLDLHRRLVIDRSENGFFRGFHWEYDYEDCLDSFDGFSSAFGLPFGGFILDSFFCPCSGTWRLTIREPHRGIKILMYVTGMPQFANYQLPRAGVWTIGLYTVGGVCLVPSGSGCSSRFVEGMISPIVGTSL